MKLRILAWLGFSLVLLPIVAAAADGRTQDTRKRTIVDYFVRLPPGTLEAPAKDWLPLARIDTANGYLSSFVSPTGGRSLRWERRSTRAGRISFTCDFLSRRRMEACAPHVMCKHPSARE